MDSKLLAQVKKDYDDLKAQGIPVSVVLYVQVGSASTVANPGYTRKKVNTAGKASGAVHLRVEPSRASGGPTVRNGDIVLATGRTSMALGVKYFHCYTEDMTIQGWLEEQYLQDA